MLGAQTTENLYIEHAATKDETAWAVLDTIETGSSVVVPEAPDVRSYDTFLRYLRWRSETGARLIIDCVARMCRSSTGMWIE